MKIKMTIAALLLSAAVFSQVPTNVQADNVNAKKTLKIAGYSIDGITDDTTLTNQSITKIMSEKATKMLIQYRMGTGGGGSVDLSSYYNKTSTDSLFNLSFKVGGNTFTGEMKDFGSNSVTSLGFLTNGVRKLVLNVTGDLYQPTSNWYIDHTGYATFSNSLTASSFIKTGGLSTEFLMANGTINSATYVQTSRTINGLALSSNITIAPSHLTQTSSYRFVTDSEKDYWNNKEDFSNKGVANGYTPLDGGSKVPIEHLPASLFIYKGTWDVELNEPSLNDEEGVSGEVYECSTNGSRDLGSGEITFAIGDRIVHNGSIWQKSPGTNFVNSVNGYTGIVTLGSVDVGLGNVPDVDATNASNISTGTLDDSRLSSNIVKITTTQTLTNKTLTSPVINTPTGIVKSDVGLGNVDNTSDATKNAASVTLTNKSISGSTNTLTNISTSSLVYQGIQTLTDGATITFNYASGYTATVTIAGNRTLAISNPVANTFGVLKVVQDGTGSRLINSWPANSKFSGGSAYFTSAANAVDILTFWYDGTNYWWNIQNDVK